MATPNYEVDYNDKRFTEVEADKKQQLNETEQLYGGMIEQSDKYYDDQKAEVDRYADKQTELQNQQTEFAIQKIEQQKEQAQKDYTKEQSGAYVDWQKESNKYGANAEQMAAMGMGGTGYSESSEVRMYTAYQNRFASARESFERTKLEYDNGIKEAQLQNSVLLAEIQYNALQKKLELNLQGFQYKNTLLLEKANKQMEINNTYYARYQDVLNQINQENALAEEVRQYNESLAFQKEQEEERIRQYNETLAYQKEQAAAEKAYKDAQLELQRAELKLQQDKAAAEAAKTAKVKSSPGGAKISPTNNNTLKVAAGFSYSPTQTSAADYLNALIKSGASKDKVSNEIALALRNGKITTAEAVKLRNSFTPRGVQYN